MHKVSKKMALAIIFIISGIIMPIFASEFLDGEINKMIEKYEFAVPIGVEIDLTTAQSMGDLVVKQKSETGEIIIGEGEIFLEKTYTYTPDTLPSGFDFHLETSDEYKESEKFQEVLDFWLGSIGHPPEVLDEMKKIPTIIGSIISGIQGILMVLRREKQDEKGYMFYECKHLVIVYIKKIEFIIH